MRKIQRLASTGAAIAALVTVAACGSTQPPTPPITTTPSPTASGNPNGVTTTADTFGSACGQLPQGRSPGSLEAMGPMPVASAAATNPLLKTLVGAVKSANLVDVLNSQRAITVFAPYDPAFDEAKSTLGAARFDALLANKEQLGSVLKYHVIARRYDKDGLLAEQGGTVATLGGGTLSIAAKGDSLTVTDGSGQTANVLCGNIPTSNATVFVIDKVLMAQKS